jgi:DNA processing protein
MMNERDAYIALNMMDRIGPVGVRTLVEVLGSAVAAFDVPENDLSNMAGLNKGAIRAILNQRDTVAWEAELEAADSMGIRIVTQVDPEYPEYLKEIHDPPLALYVKGRIELGDKNAIAIVGTRRPSHYGRDIASSLSLALARSGFTIISGLATGIDTAAHENALHAQGRTIAVLGGALDCMYPKSNIELAESIAQNGAVISEFRLGRRPDKMTFPMRNRIVSGLSKGVVVVEAGRASGALITAHQALEQGRSVFAVPGRVDSERSRGCHDLLRNGAILVETSDDVLGEYDIRLSSVERQEVVNTAIVGLSEDELNLVKLLEDGAQNIDNLIRGSGLKSSIVSGALISLEMKRVVRRMPGGIVEVIRKQGGR